jgi:ribosomal protein L22
MSEETPEIEPTESEAKPKRRRRRKKEAATASPAEGSVEASSPAEPPRDESEDQPDAEGVSRVAADEVEAQAAEGDPEASPSPEAAEVAAEPPAPQAEEEQEPEAEVADADLGPQAEEEQQPSTRRAATPVPTPAPRRRRRRGEMLDVEVRAQAKYVRSSARKARLVCDHIRGKSVEEARAILAHTPRAIARDWSKLLESAVANAEHNHELVGEDLYVKAVRADEGPTIKRYRPRALGRATRIRKRTSHLTILLTPKP